MCSPRSGRWPRCRLPSSLATPDEKARAAGPGKAGSWSARPMAAGSRSARRMCRICRPNRRRGPSTQQAWPHCVIASLMPPADRRVWASTRSSCMPPMAICCTSFCRRLPTAEPISGAAVWKTGCAFRSSCSMPCARSGRPTSLSACGCRPRIGSRAAGTSNRRWCLPARCRHAAATGSMSRQGAYRPRKKFRLGRAIRCRLPNACGRRLTCRSSRSA